MVTEIHLLYTLSIVGGDIVIRHFGKVTECYLAFGAMVH